MELLGLSETFVKGVAVTVAAFVLFVGSVYVLLSAIFGLRMGYLVLAVSFFGWMIIFSAIWTFGQPKILGVTGTLQNLGPRGTEPHWQVFAAGTGSFTTKYRVTERYPDPPWQEPNEGTESAVDTVRTAVQKYLVARADEQLDEQGGDFAVDAEDFIVQDVEFATSGHTSLAASHAFFSNGGPEITVFAYHDPGNVPVYSYAFLVVSVLGFLLHLPLLDRAERRRKEILTGGTAPPWYGPA